MECFEDEDIEKPEKLRFSLGMLGVVLGEGEELKSVVIFGGLGGRKEFVNSQKDCWLLKANYSIISRMMNGCILLLGCGRIVVLSSRRS